MNYEQTLAYLENLSKFGINLGMARIERLLELMQHPERRFKSLHVTGTNGKGSTTAMLSAILSASGIKNGMYTSPHLHDYPERMVVNGQEITKEEFAQAVTYTSHFVEQMLKDGFEQPTEFEVLTAAAFYYFAAVGVEYAVIEVGLGGLLDSTNVIIPEISVITNVTLEHTDRCGSTIADVARHKAGIIKEGVPVVTAARGEALAIIKRTAKEKHAAVYVKEEQFFSEFKGLTDGKQRVAINAGSLGQLESDLNIIGCHQVENSAVAVTTALLMATNDQRVIPETIKSALSTVKWPGRFEIVPGEPVIIIDGAHNPDGARVLRQNLDQVFPGKQITFALGILRDKDVSGIIRELIRTSDTVVTVQPLSYRAATPEEIAQEIEARHVEAAASIEQGIDRAKELAGPNGIVCVAGSLYLIGEARQIIFRK
ncbi:bifunctional folylpolyglutamate synthase/dihydrofolate synthase [Sporomusa acidovorans]|uniref:tetrahydrofolate synthase n=1 Tax=Sporomusa acidovorans (strain ATCC 49682 / DSM 3132 / Mol) TaxID=1123286 RepID=A0ABZ3J0L3_SPOA4|nr:folylpolyglutamate synthase/dihydrofolate synthase family protein [Sporomusa acidovorans]OZC22467.1 folylpolyglutamate synthase [Sporomusa acidovorans DSM 3132]SDE74161.1 dihydrofolate synthase / folylpolyglutamate synthase [Sporomusa acidovorans]